MGRSRRYRLRGQGTLGDFRSLASGPTPTASVPGGIHCPLLMFCNMKSSLRGRSATATKPTRRTSKENMSA
jgi:hypothetical protein